MPAIKYLHCVENEFSWDLVFYLTTFLQVRVSDPPFPRSNQENLLNSLWKPPYSGTGGTCTRGMSFLLLRGSGNFSHILTQLHRVLSLDATMTHCCMGVELQTVANSQSDFWSGFFSWLRPWQGRRRQFLWSLVSLYIGHMPKENTQFCKKLN